MTTGVWGGLGGRRDPKQRGVLSSGSGATSRHRKRIEDHGDSGSLNKDVWTAGEGAALCRL